MGNLKGILKHHEQDIKDEIWLRSVTGYGLGRKVEHIGEMDQTKRDKAWGVISKMTEDDFLRLRSSYDQEREVGRYVED